jgi:hypothetical protein
LDVTVKNLTLRLAAGILIGVTLLVAWYIVAADYSYGAIAGKYVMRTPGETSTLILRANQTFEQELSRDGKIQRSNGTWRRVGEGGVVFSKEFLTVEGQERRPDGQADGQIRERLGLLPSITFEPQPGGPRFVRKILS